MRCGHRSFSRLPRAGSSRASGRLRRAPRHPPLPGYMQSQAERLLGTRSRSGHGRRGGGGREELLAAHGYDTKYACIAPGSASRDWSCSPTAASLADRRRAWGLVRAVRRGEVPFDEWWGAVLRLDAMLEDRLSDDSIPAQCDAAVNRSLDGHDPSRHSGPVNPSAASRDPLGRTWRTGRIHSLDLQVRPI